jgi:hypothetical protein
MYVMCLGSFTLETIKSGTRLTAAGKKRGLRPVNKSTKISISIHHHIQEEKGH